MWQTMPLACSYYRRPRLELCHGEIILYLWRRSGEKWETKGRREWRRVKEGGGGGEKGLETRERDMNENAYAPRIHRVPLVFYFDKEPPRLHYTGEWKYRLLCRETVSGYNSLLTSISHLAGPRICTKIRETSGRYKWKRKKQKKIYSRHSNREVI